MTENAEECRPWRWKNLRAVYLSGAIAVFPWQWERDFYVYSDFEEWDLVVCFGPFHFGIKANIGNCSVEGWRGRFGLSSRKAWERSGP